MAKHKNYRPLPTSFIDPIVSMFANWKYHDFERRKVNYKLETESRWNTSSIRRLFTQESNIAAAVRRNKFRIHLSNDPLYCAMSCRLSASNLLNARDTKSSGEKIRRRGTSKCRIAFKKRARTRGSDGLKYQRSPAARLRTIRDSSPEVTNSNVKSSLNIYRVRRRLFTYADNKRSLSRWIFYICINIYVYIFEISRIFNEKFDFSVAKVVNLLLRYVLMVI